MMKRILLSVLLALLIVVPSHVSSQQPQIASWVLVDDFAGKDAPPERLWYYSRIGTDRGAMGDGVYTVKLGGGSAEFNVSNGWAGVWISLIHNAKTRDELDPRRLLGPYVLSKYQPRITGVKVHLLSGSGRIKIELKNQAGDLVALEDYLLARGQRTIEFDVNPVRRVKFLNIVLDGFGRLVMDKIWLKVEASYGNAFEAAFLYTYGHLLQCYDPASSLVRDRSNWPVEDFSSVQTIGTFALTTSIAYQLGYINQADAIQIVQGAKDRILGLSRYHGLLPHFLTKGAITKGTEWSSVDTVICLTSAILACRYMELSSAKLEAMAKAIDWGDLTANYTRPISHGYKYDGTQIATGWDTFGSEVFLTAMLYAASTDRAPILANPSPPTWDGSGFNDELAALFVPMGFVDIWGNDWPAYRHQAVDRQLSCFAQHRYNQYALFGLSASEVPEPWEVSEKEVYGAWGIGGRTSKDGSALVGSPIIAPHYAAMIAELQPEKSKAFFEKLMNGYGVLTPLNNVESLCIDAQGNLHWNSLKGSWNLSLQALGLGKALLQNKYGPYNSLPRNEFLANGLRLLCR